MRPSQNIDLQLIKAAKELLVEAGTLDIGIREIAEKAHVNSGMFYYHFKNRNDFWLQVLDEIYADFFKDFKIAASLQKNSIENLKSALMNISEFAIEHQILIIALMKGLINKDPVVISFASKNLLKHLRVLLKLIVQCQKEKLLRPIPPETALLMLMAGLNIPVIANYIIENISSYNIAVQLLKRKNKKMLNRSALKERLEVLFRGFEL